MRRLLCLTEMCIVERDPSSYSICTLKPLSDVSIPSPPNHPPPLSVISIYLYLSYYKIFAIVRDEENPQRFRIEFMRGICRDYTSTDRDSLLASVLDGVRASGNRDVFIKMKHTKRGLRIGPLSAFIDEEVETIHLKFLQQLPPGYTLTDIMIRFNCNIPYSGVINAVTQDVS